MFGLCVQIQMLSSKTLKWNTTTNTENMKKKKEEKRKGKRIRTTKDNKMLE